MIRYPGGKNKISSQIMSFIPNGIEFREPFFGGGAIGLKVLKEGRFSKYWFNDLDKHLVALWLAIQNAPEQLCKMINNFAPQVDDFEIISNYLLKSNDSGIKEGFFKLVIHQISYSGLGMMAGGPIGGKKQQSKYSIGCRWSPDYLIKKIKTINKLLSENDVKFTSLDYSELLADDCFLFLDPPYFNKGEQLYQYGFTGKHEELANKLKGRKNWFLCYDDCSEVRQLYNWAQIKEIDIKYSINGSINKKELLIRNV